MTMLHPSRRKTITLLIFQILILLNLILNFQFIGANKR